MKYLLTHTWIMITALAAVVIYQSVQKILDLVIGSLPMDHAFHSGEHHQVGATQVDWPNLASKVHSRANASMTLTQC